VVVVEDAAPLVAVHGRAAPGAERAAAALKDGDIRSAGQPEEAGGDAGAQVDVAVDDGHAEQVELRRGERQDEGERVVGIAADVGVEDDRDGRGHGSPPGRSLPRRPRRRRGEHRTGSGCAGGIVKVTGLPCGALSR